MSIPFITPRATKHAHLLIRHAEKVMRYKADVMSEAALADMQAHIDALKAAIKTRDQQLVRDKSEQLDALVGAQMPSHRESIWRENVEVIVVAVVVAVAIRSYFIQPFKIPTGSMQPTLNGIIGHPSKAPKPNILRQLVDFVVLGRNYIYVVAQTDDTVEQVLPQKYLFFFTWSRIIGGHSQYLVYCPPDTLRNDFKVVPGSRYRRGDVIAAGAVDTGDQVFVDKFSYNFVKPHRGDVFVFRTNNIFGIQEDPQSGAPYYIKRLAGEPNDDLRIDPPLLYVNGQPAEGYGFERVMQAKFPYRGYASGRDYLGNPGITFHVPEHKYFAMGDNSYFSYDSRWWGPVPEENLVGRGLWVYWPFSRHWGFIR